MPSVFATTSSEPNLLTELFFFAAYVALAGRNGSSVYSWRSDVSLLTVVLRAPPASSFLSLAVQSPINVTKTLLASAEENSSTLYEFTSVSNQSDFIPRYKDRLKSETKAFGENPTRKPTSHQELCVLFFFSCQLW